MDNKVHNENIVRKLIPHRNPVVNPDDDIKKQLEQMIMNIDLKEMFEEWMFQETLRSYGWYRFDLPLTNDSGSK